MPDCPLTAQQKDCQAIQKLYRAERSRIRRGPTTDGAGAGGIPMKSIRCRCKATGPNTPPVASKPRNTIMRSRFSRAALVSSLAVLVACASGGTVDFDRGMATYVGQPEVRLVEGLGVPERIYETDGRRFLEYSFSSAAAPASSGFSFGVGAGSFSSGGRGRGGGFGTGIGLGFPLGSSGYDAMPCVVTFEVRDERVLNFSRQGDHCR